MNFKSWRLLLVVAGLSLVVPATSWSNPNTRYGEVLFSKLPLRGTVSKIVWVGSWWAYKRDGIAYRLHDPAMTGLSWWGDEYKKKTDRFDADDPALYSPAEKLDKLLGRIGKVERDKVKAYLAAVQEKDSEVATLMKRQQELVYRINRMLAEHESDPSWDWRETPEGKEYLDNKKKIEDAQKSLADKKFTVDTATEFEVLEHGLGQFGVEGWYGHCNAWAAAAVMEPEPRRDATVDGVTLTPGDVKGLLTEAWMECSSSFYGSRNDWDKDEEAKKEVDFQDVTPAAFHIFFADQIGNRDKSFVIDQCTGAEVWNQPVKSYRFSVKPLYQVVDGVAKPQEVDVKLTDYSGGEGRVKNLGKKSVYPVLVTATIHWMHDGLPHETLTIQNYRDDIDDQTYATAYKIREMYDDQVDLRTLTYVLWLTAPMDDPKAEIIGDGEWQDSDLGIYAHPDFMWQPLSNTNNYRVYENEYVDYKYLTATILPQSIASQDSPQTQPGTYTATGLPLDIPDNSPSACARATIPVAHDLTVYKASLELTIRHTYIGDLRVRLHLPDGSYRTLKNYWIGGSADDIEKTYSVKKVKGQPAKGDWVLEVCDNAASDTGRIERAVLKITPQE